MTYRSDLLSVIVPCYNIEQYLKQCVTSILASDYPFIEIILVDDGSLDSTGALCDQLAAEHESVSVVHQENLGLGAARNTGIACSKGEFLAFVDSDDIVMPDAYSAMIASLKASGSAFCVGGVERFNSKRTWFPWFVEEVHAIDRLKTNAQEFPPLVWNVFAWSKVFRRKDFDDIVGSFPVGILYEDQEMSAKIYTCGRGVDIIAKTVYRWRAREDSSSITQNKTSIADLSDRLEVARHSADVIDSAGSLPLKEYWYRKFLGEDLWWYFRVVPHVTDTYWVILCAAVREFVSRAPASVLPNLQPKRRALVTAAYHNRRAAFEERLHA